MAPNDSWLNRQLKAGVSGLGSAAGGVVTAVGNGVSGAGKGVGNGIASASRSWGNVVRSYGNTIKDATGAGGRRAPTANNPLGLGGTPSSAKASSKIQKGSSSTRGSANDPLGLGGRF